MFVVVHQQLTTGCYLIRRTERWLSPAFFVRLQKTCEADVGPVANLFL